MSSSKRQSMMPGGGVQAAGPKAPVHFAPSIVIAEYATITGTYPVTVGADSVVHPRARLDSGGGPVNIGRRCIVDERTRIGAPPSVPGVLRGEGSVTLGDNVTVEVGAIVETGGTTVGEGSVVGVGSHVGSRASIGRYCTLAPKTIVPPGEKIPDYTVVYSNGMRRQDKRAVAELRSKGQARKIEVLRKLISSQPAKFQ